MSSLTEDQVVARLTPVFRDVLGQRDLTIARNLDASKVRGWDSLAHVSLVAAVEEEFSVRFALGELQDLQNVGDMIDLILAKLA